jgi:hypothetical protein
MRQFTSFLFIFCIVIFFPCLSLEAQESNLGARGREIMISLYEAYPRLVGRPMYRDGDWAVLLRKKWFYYAEGRLLPAELRLKAADFDPQPFYSYVPSLPPWRAPSAAETERLQKYSDDRQTNEIARSNDFFDTLWNIHSRDDAYKQVKTILFLGRKVMVHHAIMEPLAMVEQKIQAAAKTDKEVAQWIKNLTLVSAWNWRNIAETQSRSNHAYGTAIDCLMPSKKGMETYWLWAAERHPDWWAVPYALRLTPPLKVIKAFESYGFVWGGKWLFYDTMHFEYRPESILLSFSDNNRRNFT